MSEQEKLELERYRAFHQRLRRRREEIPGELEALRQAGQGQDRAVSGASQRKAGGGDHFATDAIRGIGVRKTGWDPWVPARLLNPVLLPLHDRQSGQICLQVPEEAVGVPVDGAAGRIFQAVCHKIGPDPRLQRSHIVHRIVAHHQAFLRRFSDVGQNIPEVVRVGVCCGGCSHRWSHSQNLPLSDQSSEAGSPPPPPGKSGWWQAPGCSPFRAERKSQDGGPPPRADRLCGVKVRAAVEVIQISLKGQGSHSEIRHKAFPEYLPVGVRSVVCHHGVYTAPQGRKPASRRRNPWEPGGEPSALKYKRTKSSCIKGARVPSKSNKSCRA